MRYQFEIGARVVPKDMKDGAVGVVIDRAKMRGWPNRYLVQITLSDDTAMMLSVAENVLMRKTDG